MSLKKSNKNTNLWIITGSLTFLLIVASALLYVEKYKYKINNVQYFSLKKVVAQSNNYVVASTLSITSNDIEELKNYETEIKVILEKTIFNTDLSQLDNSEKITILQKQFRKNLREELPELKINKVIMTDFIYTVE